MPVVSRTIEFAITDAWRCVALVPCRRRLVCLRAQAQHKGPGFPGVTRTRKAAKTTKIRRNVHPDNSGDDLQPTSWIGSSVSSLPTHYLLLPRIVAIVAQGAFGKLRAAADC